jgi:hypothetical protein
MEVEIMPNITFPTDRAIDAGNGVWLVPCYINATNDFVPLIRPEVKIDTKPAAKHRVWTTDEDT